MALSWLKPSAALLLGAALMGAGFSEPDPKRMVGTWVLTDNENVPFNLILRPDGSSLTVTGKRHPDVGTSQRMTRNQLLENGNWQTWGNGIRSTYSDGWTDTIQIGPAGAVQWSWKPGSSLNDGPSNHGKAVQLKSPVMNWVGAYKLEPMQQEKPPYLAVLTSSGMAFNNIDQVADGSWSLTGNGSVLIKWTSGWRSLIEPTANGIPGPEESFAVKHWRPGVPTSKPANANRSGVRL